MKFTKLLLSLTLAVFLVSLVLITAIKAEEPSGTVNVLWDDPAVITAPLVLAYPITQSTTISQYIDFRVLNSVGVMVAQSSVEIEAGAPIPGTGIAASALYDFDLPPGNYQLLVRLRIEVDTEYLEFGYDPDDLEFTTERTFYGINVWNDEIIPNNALGYAYVADIIVIEFERIYLPIIVKKAEL